MRMLGRYHVRGLKCAIRFGRYCGDCGWDGGMGARYAKRMEARQVAEEIAAELADMDAGHWPALEETEAEDAAAGRIDEAKVAEIRERMRDSRR